MIDKTGKRLLRVLIVEDFEDDALLVLRELQSDSFSIAHERVDSKKAFLKAITEKEWDLILCDYSLPHFRGTQALRIVQERGLDIPFIFVSGAIGEDVAVQAMKDGAHDYVMKGNLKRLLPAVVRELKDAEDRRARKAAEKALRESDERFRLLIEKNLDIITLVDRTGKILYHSPSMERVLGYSPEEISGLNAFDFVHPEDLNRISTLFAELIATPDGLKSATMRARHKDRSWRWLSVTAQNFLENPAIKGVILNFHDVTQDREAQEALRQSEERFRQVVEHATDVIFTTNPDGYFLYVNHAGLNISGYSVEELQSMHFTDLILPDYKKSVAKKYHRQFLSRTENSYTEYPFRTKQGKTIWFGQNAKLIMEGSEIKGFYVISRDITERKMAEEALRENEERFRIVAEQTGQLIYDYDISSGSIQWAGAISRVTGYDTEEMKAFDIHQWEDHIHPEDHAQVLESLNESIRTQSLFHAEYRFRRKDGSYIVVEDNGIILPDTSGKPYRMLGTINNITKRKEAETKLKLAEEKFRSIVENATLGIFQSTPDGRTIMVNQVMANMLGYDSPQQLIEERQDIAREGYVDPGKRNEFKRLMEENGEVKGFEFSAYRKDKSIIWVRVSARPIRDIQGHIIYYEGFLEDITDKRHADEKLMLLSSAINAAANAILITDREGTIQSINPAFTHLTGYSFEQVYHENPQILKSGYQSEEFYENLWNTITHGNVWKGTLINKRRDGTLYHEEQTITPIKNAYGEITHFIAVKEDVTERKRAEEELIKSREFVERILQSLTAHVAVLDSRGTIIAVNEAWKNFARENEGSSLAESPIGMNYFEVCERAAQNGDTLAGEVLNGIRDVLSEKLPYFRCEYPCHSPNQQRWFSMRVTPLSDGSSIVISHSNITERKIANDIIAASERKLRTLIENSSDIIAIIDPEGNYKYQSPAAERVLGYESDEFDGRNAFEFIHPEDRAYIRGLIERNIAKQGAIVTAEYRFLHKDGSWRVMQSIGKNMLHDPQLNGIVINSRDITEKILYEKELLVAKERAEQADKLKDAFIANISHEIRTPLNVMFGFMELLRQGNASFSQSEIEEFHDSIRRSGNRLMRTVDEILSISLLTTGAYKSHFEIIDVVGQLEALIIDLQPLAQEKNLTLELTAESHPQIEGDLYSFIQTASNLLDNAIKFTKQGGIFVRVFEETETVKVSIRDTGIGIGEEYLPSLYQAFSQEVGGYTRPYEGVGLGMALVKRYMDLNNGHIEVHSEKNKGTEFVLTFPYTTRRHEEH